MLAEFNNKKINRTMLEDIYIAVNYDGRTLHALSNLNGHCDEKNINP